MNEVNKQLEVVESKIENQKSKINSIYISYFENIQSVQLFLDKLSSKAQEEDLAIMKSYTKYVDEAVENSIGKEAFENIKKIAKNENIKDQNLEEENEDTEVTKDAENTEESIIISRRKFEQFMYLISRAPKMPTNNFIILTNGAFLMLNNYFEYLFADLLSFHFSTKTNIIEEKNISISLSELKNYSSIDEAHQDLLYREIEKLLLDLNFEEIKDYFKKLDVHLSEDLINWDLINEIRERRHIIVHNNSIVNRKYITKSKNIFQKNEGEKIEPTSEYLKNAINEVLYAGVILIFNCWGKWDAKRSTDAISEIMDLTFKLLKDKNYNLVLRFATYVEKYIKPKCEKDEGYLLSIRINKCLSLKKMNDSSLQNEIKNLKVSMLSPIYKVAKMLLEDDLENAKLIFNQVIDVDDILVDQYLEWPLFEDLRNDEEINKHIIELFKIKPE